MAALLHFISKADFVFLASFSDVCCCMTELPILTDYFLCKSKLGKPRLKLDCLIHSKKY